MLFSRCWSAAIGLSILVEADLEPPLKKSQTLLLLLPEEENTLEWISVSLLKGELCAPLTIRSVGFLTFAADAVLSLSLSLTLAETSILGVDCAAASASSLS